ncbi:MAG: hypothetical protein ACP5RH_16680, partial [Leptodesmis sp.]|uniref:hypothetical protein n=1 Tax=Leptodesmis sp. TaxID=3100501 RepID=UPI003D0E423F
TCQLALSVNGRRSSSNRVLLDWCCVIAVQQDISMLSNAKASLIVKLAVTGGIECFASQCSATPKRH